MKKIWIKLVTFLLIAPLIVVAAGASTLEDNFDDNSLDGAKWNDLAGAQSTEQNQRLEMVRPAATAAYYSVVSLAGDYSIDEDAFFVEVAEISDISDVTQEIILDYSSSVDGDDKFQFIFSDGGVIAFYYVNGASTEVGSYTTYDPVDYAYVRIREAGGTVFFEYSADATTWNVHGSVATPAIDITSGYLTMSIGAYTSGEGAAYVYWDNFNIEPLPCDPYTTRCTERFTTAGYDEWTVPADVTSLDVACWGAGGGGFDDNTGANGGAGGGGGAFASSTHATSAGSIIRLFIGSGGGEGQGGTDSVASTTAPAIITLADAGTGATSATANGVGGTTANSTGSVEFAGGAGGDANTTGDIGGGGGGSAGPHGAGGTAANATGGVGSDGGAGDNGNGGAGGAGGNGGDGQPGGSNVLGGGGGGGGDNATNGGAGGAPGGGGGGAEGNGGAGGNGQCQITYSAVAAGGGSYANPDTFWDDL